MTMATARALVWGSNPLSSTATVALLVEGLSVFNQRSECNRARHGRRRQPGLDASRPSQVPSQGLRSRPCRDDDTQLRQVVARSAMQCNIRSMSEVNEISQRDLRTRSKEIMDAVESGHRFTVTRDGRGIAELVPLRGRRTFVPVAEFVALGRGLTSADPDRLRADIDSMGDQLADDPYAR